MTEDTDAETSHLLRELLDSYDTYGDAFSALTGVLWRISASYPDAVLEGLRWRAED